MTRALYILGVCFVALFARGAGGDHWAYLVLGIGCLFAAIVALIAKDPQAFMDAHDDAYNEGSSSGDQPTEETIP